VALEQHNTAFEFETMLRRHLSQGGAMVEACAGFDADTASAYLENVLGQIARSRYESHLAGCPSCRRHVIGLSQLLQLPQVSPQAETQTSPSAKPESTWAKWKTAAAGWFDIPAWNRGWATAGAGAAVLLAVMATQYWRQAPPAEIAGANMVSSASPTGNTVFDSQTQSAASTEQLIAIGDSSRQQQTLMRSIGVPAPEVTPNLGSAAPVSTLEIEAGKVMAATAATRPVITTLPVPPNSSGQIVTSFGQNLASSQPAIRFDASPVPPVPEMPAPGTGDTVAAAETAKIIAPLNPSPSDNPMTRSRRASPTPTPKTLGGFSFLPSGKSETERKAELKEIEEGAPKLLTVRVRDKIFSFQGGMWVDHAYKPDMAWRVTKLMRDSEEYKQALATEPQLKEFFERSAVIVVWKDKIYKVVPK